MLAFALLKIFGDELRRQIMALREFILILVLYLHPFSVFLVKHLQFVLNSLPTKRTFNKGNSSLYLTHLSVKCMPFCLSSLKKALHFLQLFPTNFGGRFYRSYRAVDLSNWGSKLFEVVLESLVAVSHLLDWLVECACFVND